MDPWNYTVDSPIALDQNNGYYFTLHPLLCCFNRVNVHLLVVNLITISLFIFIMFFVITNDNSLVPVVSPCLCTAMVFVCLEPAVVLCRSRYCVYAGWISFNGHIFVMAPCHGDIYSIKTAMHVYLYLRLDIIKNLRNNYTSLHTWLIVMLTFEYLSRCDNDKTYFMINMSLSDLFLYAFESDLLFGLAK